MWRDGGADAMCSLGCYAARFGVRCAVSEHPPAATRAGGGAPLGAGEHRWLKKGRERGKGGTLWAGGREGRRNSGGDTAGWGSVLKVCADIGTPSTPVRPALASEFEARVSRNQRHVFRDAVV